MRQQILDKAKSLGFDVVRIGKPVDNTEKLLAWLGEGYHGTMAWLAENPEGRGNPQNLWPPVRSLIAVGINYGPATNPLPGLLEKDNGYISIYARGEDYHRVLRKRLRALGFWMRETFGCECRSFVDTAPVMEKPLAQAAGIGWQGKHTNLVSREFGSWLFLGMLYTDLDLVPDSAGTDSCGNCRACLDACPTNAFPRPYTLDARRCLSYLLIEHRDPIPLEFRKIIGNRIYGCDDCLAACPWNKFAQTARIQNLQARDELVMPPLESLLDLTEEEFRTLFRFIAIKRMGRLQFLRNVCYAMGNSGNPKYIPLLEPLKTHDDFSLADAAAWACQELVNT